MNRLVKFVSLLVVPLLISGCNRGDNVTPSGEPTPSVTPTPTKEPYVEPTSEESESLNIPLRNGTILHVDKDTNVESFNNLINFDYFNSNCDTLLDVSLKSENQEEKETHKTESQIRNTNINDKHGYYQSIVSENYISRNASFSPFAEPYCGFEYYKKDEEYISLFGRILSPEEIEKINNHYGGTIVYGDSSYEPGIYGRDDLPNIPSPSSDSGMAGIIVFEQIIKQYSCYHISSLLNVSNASISFKVTKDYLVLDINVPNGILSDIIPGSDAEKIIEQAEEENCYLNTRFYYDVTSGELAFFKANFKTNYIPSYRFVITEGTLIIDVKKESLEGYEKYIEMREEVMSVQNERR